ncbi:MAG TPA: hypothetical protein VLF94_01555, partial [Chlamydiales bacterium]|nr:hypothetical protein [Chlamydiales bacterium]
MANGVRPAAPNQAAEAVVKRDFFKGAASLFGAGILGAVTKCTTIIALNYVALAWGVVGTLACYSVTKLGPIFSDGYEAARQEFQDLIARKVSLGNASLGAAAGAIVTLASS